MFGTRWKRLLLFYFVLEALSRVATGAIHVSVRVQIGAPAVLLVWGPSRTPGILAQVEQSLAGELRKQFRHWEFQPGGETRQVELCFRLLEKQPETLAVVLEHQEAADLVQQVAEEIWLAPGELAIRGGYPVASEAASSLSHAFLTFIMGRHKSRIEEILRQRVPVATEGQWDDQNRVVLPLAWENFKELRNSLFELACKSSSNEKLRLISHGQEQNGVFKPPPPNPSYSALALMPRKEVLPNGERDLTSDDFSRLRGQFIHLLAFLKEVRPPDNWDIFSPGGAP